ncbi:MAG TPA: NUDIX domain-containing protein [Vicinamibacterales bacterium]|nr:NUDIX domain-containing protein [Vicinamibacterales bacterium]
MPRRESAGLVMYRRRDGALEVLLAHPGGPFWQARDAGAWTIPKGGLDEGEAPLDAAIREFHEETGFDGCPPYVPLGQITQKSGKVVHAWAFDGTCDPAALVSVEATIEWPPRSGRHIAVPEVDRVQFFTIPAARSVINPAQAALLDRLVTLVGG